MPTEVATYINQLDALQPPDATGPVGEGDDHLRLLKAVLQASFPSISGAMTLTHTQLNGLANTQADLDALEAQTIAAGAGIAISGASLSAGHTVAMDIVGLPAIGSLADADSVPFYDASGAAIGRFTLGTLGTTLDHNQLQNYAANRHIDHSAVSINTGNGIDGGGDLTSTRTLTVAGGNGLNQTSTGLEMSGSFTGTFTATVDVAVSSDAALKEDFREVDWYALIEWVRPWLYRRKDTGQDQYGVVAQELEPYMPEAVHEGPDGKKTVAYMQLIPVLIGALQDANRRIHDLEAVVAP